MSRLWSQKAFLNSVKTARASKARGSQAFVAANRAARRQVHQGLDIPSRSVLRARASRRTASCYRDMTCRATGKGQPEFVDVVAMCRHANRKAVRSRARRDAGVAQG